MKPTNIAYASIAMLVVCQAFASEWKTAEFISETDASQSFLIPEKLYVSQYGKGMYRLDRINSFGPKDISSSAALCIRVTAKEKSIMEGLMKAAQQIMEKNAGQGGEAPPPHAGDSSAK